MNHGAEGLASDMLEEVLLLPRGPLRRYFHSTLAAEGVVERVQRSRPSKCSQAPPDLITVPSTKVLAAGEDGGGGGLMTTWCFRQPVRTAAQAMRVIRRRLRMAGLNQMLGRGFEAAAGKSFCKPAGRRGTSS
jgi:hypothetical protein